MYPVVFELLLILAPFWLLRICESSNKMFVTLLLLLPPTDPMLRPWPPSQYIPETVTLLPLVIATQSSWFSTVLSRIIVLLQVLTSNPSVLWAAGRPSDRLLGALPAVLSRVMPDITKPAEFSMLKQCVG